MHLLFLVGCLSILALAQPPATNPSQWPGWGNLQNCVQEAIVDYGNYPAGCGDWQCACEHSRIAAPEILSAAIGGCSSDAEDTSTATSIFNWFCSQFPYSTASLLGPPVTNPSQWPGWGDLRNCVQEAIVNYGNYYADCGDWQCACQHSSIAAPEILSAVIGGCSSNEPDIAVATSIFNSQFPYSTASLLPGITITNPSQWPGWGDVRGCVQEAIVDYGNYYAGCGDWICVCEHGSVAEADIISAAISSCSSNQPDIAVATSIFNSFCAQLPGVVGFQYASTSTAAPVAGASAQAVTETPPAGASTQGSGDTVNCHNVGNVASSVGVNLFQVFLCFAIVVYALT